MRRAAVGVLAGTLAFTGGAIAAGVSPANAVEGFAFERLAGADRYGTAAAIARDGFPNADTVVLASGAPRNFPDALTGNYLAGDVQGPILLTAPGSLPQVTEDALESLGAENVIIVGGTAAVSSSVEAELERLGYDVDREGGVDRYATAELVAKRVGQNATSTTVGEDPAGARTAILGNGQNFPDILAAGPISYSEMFPIAITRPNDLPASTEDVLRDLGIERVIIVGGPTAVSAAVEAEVDAIVDDVDRIAGQTRFATAVNLADFAYDELGFDETHVSLARGDDFADALAGGPHGGEERAPIVLTFPTTLQPNTADFLEERCPTLESGHIFGGPVAVSNAVETQAETAASSCDAEAGFTVAVDDSSVPAGDAFTGTITADQAITSVDITGACITAADNQTDQSATTAGFQFSVDTLPGADAGTCTLTFTVTFADGTTATDTVNVTVEDRGSDQTFAVTPQERAINTFSTTTGPDANRGARTYTAQVGDATAVDIALIPVENITFNQDGTLVFRDADSDQNRADDLGNTLAVIETVNGVAVPASDYQNNIATNGNAVTFTVDSTNVNEEVIPVIFVDQDNNNQLNLGADNRAVAAEPFGLGGAKLFVPAEAAFGTDLNQEVQLVDTVEDFFTAEDDGANTNQALYEYDADDAFRYNSRNGDPTISLTLTQFETYLSGVSGRSPNVGGLGGVQGDEIDINYNPDGSSTFTITSDVPLAPTGVTATVGNFEPGTDTANNDIRITWTAPPNPDVAYYRIYRATVNPTTGAAGTYSQVGQVNGRTNTEFNNFDVAPATGSTTYRYIVVAFNDDNEAGPNSNAVDVVINASTGTATPISIASDVEESDAEGPGPTDEPGQDVLDAGDALEFTFDSPITVAEGASITLRDDDGTLVRLTDNGNAQFSVSGTNNNVLTIDVTGNPTLVELNGGSANLELTPGDFAAVTDSTGITNANGAWNLPASGCSDECDVDGTRVVSEGNFDNDDLPEALDANALRANPEADQVTLDDDADAFGGDIENGDTFFIYNAKGVQVATGVYNGTDGEDQTVNITGGFAPGDVLYFVYIDNDNSDLPSETTQINNPGDIPTVTDVSAAEELPADLIRVQFSDDDCPDPSGVGITQVGPASNYQVYDADNNVLVATGEAVSGSPTGGACGPLTVDLNAELQAGVDYVLRVAANTVQDPNNTPNAAEIERFTLFANPPEFSNVTADGDATTFGGTTTTNDTTPAVQGTVSDNAPINGVYYQVFTCGFTAFITDGFASATDGAFDETSEGFTFTPTLPGEGCYTVRLFVEDDEGGSDFYTFNIDVEGAAAPTLNTATTDPANDRIILTYSEDVNCVNTANSRAAFDFSNASVDEGAAGQPDGAPAAVSDLGGNQCALSYPGLEEGDFGTLEYDQPAGSGDQFTDASSTPVGSSTEDVVDTTDPDLTAIAASATTDTITLTFDEPVSCASVGIGDFDVEVNGVNVDGQNTAVNCTGPADTTVELVFNDGQITAGAGVEVTVVGTVTDESGDNSVPANDSASTIAAA